ncbi:MAG: phage tail tape measure protein [Alphaproteobacteria bacterium]|nr:MAG: phage tail tape measure protein [Alphaproteobacteria bacterium]
MSSKNQHLNATITIGSVLEGSVKRNIGFLKSGLSQVGNSIKEVERRQKELDRQRNVLRRQGQSVEHLDREYEKLERTLHDLRHAQQRWNRAAAASRRVGSTFKTMAADIGRNVRRITVGATLAGGAIFGLASSTARLGDDVAKTADKLGIGIEELQELRYAAERSGVATSAFDTALEKMTKNIGLAMEGTGAQKDALDALGISAANLATMSPDEALGVIADRLQRVETQAEKAAIANDLFGRSGIGMLNMLREGSTGLAQLSEDARRTGYVLSEQAARDAEVFQDTLLDTQLVMKGLKNTVGAELMPVVTQAMRRVGDTLIENREAVQQWAEGFADGVERALPLIGEVVTGIGKVGSIVWDVVTATADMVGGWENFGMMIGAVLASRTIVLVGKFGSAVFSLGKSMFALARTTPLVVGGIRAIGAALLMNPIGMAVAAIAGGAALIYANWDTVGPWFNGLWGDVKTTFQGFGDFVGGVFTGDMDRVASGIQAMWKGTKSVLGRVMDGIGGVFRASYNNLIRPVTDALGITEPIEAAWRAAGAVLGPLMGDIGGYFSGLSDVVGGVFTGDMDRAASGIQAMWKGTKSVLGRVMDGIGGIFRASYNNLIRPVTDALGITEPIERAWSTFQTAIDTVVGAIGAVFDTTWTTFIKPVIDGLSATDGIGAAWETVKSAIDPILKWIGDKFQAVMTFIQPVIDALNWAMENAQAAGNAISGALGIGNGPDIGEVARESAINPGQSGLSAKRRAKVIAAQRARLQSMGVPEDKLPPLQANALGGPFRSGWHLTGELGPELKFENRSGYVANNRALRQLAGYADRVGSLMAQPRTPRRRAGTVMERAARIHRSTGRQPEADNGMAARVNALFAQTAGAAQATPSTNQVTQNITYTIHAAGASAEEVIRLVERKSRHAAGNGLFDRAPAIGPYGR